MDKYYCIDCGIEIHKTTSKYGTGRCRSCVQSGTRSRFYKDGRTLKAYYCIDCGTRITSQAKRCSSCAGKGKLGSRWLGGLPNCIDCGKILCRRQSKSKRCKKCTRVLWGLSHSLDNAPNWRGGKSFEPYSIKWTNKLKEIIRERDIYKCRLCNKTEKDNGRKLDVHHIDYDKKNCSSDNLICLCSKCHGKTHFNREFWQAVLHR